MRFVLFALTLFPLIALGQPEAPPPPPPPEDVEEAERLPPEDPGALEPTVRIIEQGESVIEEYSAGGTVYMVKIDPAGGPPYYLIDTDGDGRLETHRFNLADPEVQQWILFRW